MPTLPKLKRHPKHVKYNRGTEPELEFYRIAMRDVSEVLNSFVPDQLWDTEASSLGSGSIFELILGRKKTGKFIVPFLTEQFHDSRYQKRVVEYRAVDGGEWCMPRPVYDALYLLGEAKVFVVLYYGTRAYKRGIDPKLSGTRRDKLPRQNETSLYRRGKVMKQLPQMRVPVKFKSRRKKWLISSERVWWGELDKSDDLLESNNGLVTNLQRFVEA